MPFLIGVILVNHLNSGFKHFERHQFIIWKKINSEAQQENV